MQRPHTISDEPNVQFHARLTLLRAVRVLLRSRFNVPIDTNLVISEEFFPANLFVSTTEESHSTPRETTTKRQ